MITSTARGAHKVLGHLGADKAAPKVKPILPGRIFLSNSTSPLHNLAYEQWLFGRGTEDDVPVLFIYRNRPSIIIGRNQNPWAETTPSDLAKREILLLRRYSGGGAVYHDEGNTNYCIMLPSSVFSRPANAQLVLSAVHALGVTEASVNQRNDIYVGPYKISGSAYRMTSGRSYHHGTMLLTTPVDRIKGSLTPSFPDPPDQSSSSEAAQPRIRLISSRGVESVRSPVENLLNLAPDEVKPNITHEAFRRALSKAFRQAWGGDSPPTVENTDNMIWLTHTSIRRDVEHFETWDWVYGQTPMFQVQAPFPRPEGEHNATYTVDKGRITKVEIMLPAGRDSIDPTLEEQATQMLNQPWDVPPGVLSPY